MLDRKEQLRGPVVRSADAGSVLAVGESEKFRKPEISNFDHSIFTNENIFRLQILRLNGQSTRWKMWLL